MAVMLTTAYPREEDMADHIVVSKLFTAQALWQGVIEAVERSRPAERVGGSESGR